MGRCDTCSKRDRCDMDCTGYVENQSTSRAREDWNIEKADAKRKEEN